MEVKMWTSTLVAHSIEELEKMQLDFSKSGQFAFDYCFPKGTVDESGLDRWVLDEMSKLGVSMNLFTSPIGKKNWTHICGTVRSC